MDKLCSDHRNLIQARQKAEAVWAYLQQQGAKGMLQPLRPYLTCYEVFKVARDEKTAEALSTVYHLLQTQAARLTNEI